MSEEIEPGVTIKPSIKLSVSTKGVYTWEIRIIGHDVNELVNIDKQLKDKFGGQTDGST